MSSSPPNAVACPGPLKGVLSAQGAAAALQQGFARVGVECVTVPLADGGEGTLAAFARAFGGDEQVATVHDSLGREVEAVWRRLPDGRAVVESAQAIGLSLLRPEERAPLRASSRGLGELMLAAAEEAAELVVGLGDSAVVDGGAGLGEAIGELPLPTTALCDVRAPLGAAALVFAAQKGAAPEEAEELARRIAAMEEIQPFADLPGAGAAGGIGAALAALGARLVPGAEYVIEAVGLAERIRGAQLVVTGEGVVDATSLEGKVAATVASVCAEEGVRCVVFGGRVEVELPGADMHPLSGDPTRAWMDLVALGEELGR
jgi:glycerate 2-kinase